MLFGGLDRESVDKQPLMEVLCTTFPSGCCDGGTKGLFQMLGAALKCFSGSLRVFGKGYLKIGIRCLSHDFCQRPARAHVEAGRRLCLLQVHGAGEGNHGAVVGAQR